MSTTTLHPTTTRAPGPSPRDEVTFPRVMNSEWIKLRTLRSSWYTLGGAVLGMILIGLAVAYATSTANWAKLDPEDTVAFAPLQGWHLVQLVVGVLGVLFVTGEYGTGMIRSTFTAVPRRLPVLAAKSVVFGTLALVVMTLTSFATFFIAQIILSGDGHGSSLSDAGALRAVGGLGLYLALVGLMGGGIGWVVRSTAGAISSLVGLLLVLPIVFGFLPGSFSTTVTKYLPGSAGEAFLTTSPQPNVLAPWAGLGVFSAWVAVTLVAAVVVIRRRDT